MAAIRLEGDRVCRPDNVCRLVRRARVLNLVVGVALRADVTGKDEVDLRHGNARVRSGVRVDPSDILAHVVGVGVRDNLRPPGRRRARLAPERPAVAVVVGVRIVNIAVRSVETKLILEVVLHEVVVGELEARIAAVGSRKTVQAEVVELVGDGEVLRDVERPVRAVAVCEELHPVGEAVVVDIGKLPFRGADVEVASLEVGDRVGIARKRIAEVERVLVPRIGRVPAAVVLVEVGEQIQVAVAVTVIGDPGIDDIVLRRLFEHLHAVVAEHRVEFPAVGESVEVEVGALSVQRPIRPRLGRDDRAYGGEVVRHEVLILLREALRVDPLGRRNASVRRVLIEAEPFVDLVVDKHNRLVLMPHHLETRQFRRRVFDRPAEAKRLGRALAVAVGGVERHELGCVGSLRDYDSAVELVRRRLDSRIRHNVPDPVRASDVVRLAKLDAVELDRRIRHHVAFKHFVAVVEDRIVVVFVAYAVKIEVADLVVVADRRRGGRPPDLLLAVDDAVVVPIGVLQVDGVRSGGACSGGNRNGVEGHAGRDLQRVRRRQVAVVAPRIVRAALLLRTSPVGGILHVPCRNVVLDALAESSERDNAGRISVRNGDRVREVGLLVCRDCDTIGEVDKRMLDVDRNDTVADSFLGN